MALRAKIIVVLRTEIVVSADSGDSTDSTDSSDSSDSGDSGDLSCESRLCGGFGSQLCEINVSGDVG